MQPLPTKYSVIVFVLLGLTCWAPLQAQTVPTADEVLGDMDWSAGEKTKILAGEFVTGDVKNVTDRELSVAIGFLVKTSPADLAKQVVSGVGLHADPQVAAHGTVQAEASAQDFQGVTLTGGAAEVFLEAKAGSSVNLSSGELKAFQASSGQTDASKAAEAQLRAMLLARHHAYRTSGLDGIAPYDRGGEQRRGGDDLRKASAGTVVVKKRFPAFYDMMNGYPKASLPGMEERFYWVQYGKGGKANYVLEQMVTASDGDVHAIMQRQYYASQGYNVEQAVAGFFPVEEGTLVVYVNRTSTDQVAGFGGSAKRSIGRKMMTGQLEKMFQGGRKIVEQ